MVFRSGLDQSQKQRVKDEEKEEEEEEEGGEGYLLWLLLCNTGENGEIIIKETVLKTILDERL